MFASVLMLAVLSSGAPRAMQTPAAAPETRARAADGPVHGESHRVQFRWASARVGRFLRQRPSFVGGLDRLSGSQARVDGRQRRLRSAGGLGRCLRARESARRRRFHGRRGGGLGDRDRAQGPRVRRTAWRFHYRDDLHRVRPRREVADRKHRRDDADLGPRLGRRAQQRYVAGGLRRGAVSQRKGTDHAGDGHALGQGLGEGDEEADGADDERAIGGHGARLFLLRRPRAEGHQLRPTDDQKIDPAVWDRRDQAGRAP